MRGGITDEVSPQGESYQLYLEVAPHPLLSEFMQERFAAWSLSIQHNICQQSKASQKGAKVALPSQPSPEEYSKSLSPETPGNPLAQREHPSILQSWGTPLRPVNMQSLHLLKGSAPIPAHTWETWDCAGAACGTSGGRPRPQEEGEEKEEEEEVSPKDPLRAVCPAVSIRTRSSTARRGPSRGWLALGANFQLFSSQLVFSRHPGVPSGQPGGRAPASRP
ncbi:hypothetical protein H8959_000787 [Pygathrix nigripes]